MLRKPALICILILSLLLSFLPAASLASPGPDLPPLPNGAAAAPAQTDSSLFFVENVGQFPGEARFSVPGANAWLTGDGLWLRVAEEAPPNESGTIGSQPAQNGVNLRLGFVGSNENVRIEPFGHLNTRVNYYLGDDASKWRENVPAWSGVRYKNLYPGVDLEVSGASGKLTWRWVTADASVLDSIKLRVDGGESLASENGSLIVSTAAGPVKLALPRAAGTVARAQVRGNEVSAPFATETAGAAPQPLATGSGLSYSTFMGGSDGDYGLAIGVDAAGSAYVTGKAQSSDFPTTLGPAIQGLDAFVVKLNADGSDLVYATFVGGSSYDWGKSIAVADDGTAFVAGSTGSADFPTTSNAYSQVTRRVFVTKIDASGSLAYSTYLGGSPSNWDGWYSLAVTANDNAVVYVTGNAESSDFPTTPDAYRATRNGTSNDSFVTKLSTVITGTSGLLYSTYFGGAKTEYPYAIEADSDGSVYITGQTYSDVDFPVTSGAYDSTYKGSFYGEGFVTKFSSTITGSLNLDYSTFLGGTGLSKGYGIAVDTAGSAYVTGYTETSDFPVTAGAPGTSLEGVRDAFVTKLNATGSDLVYSTYLGGGGSEYGRGIAVDDTGVAYVAGNTISGDFPVTGNAFDGTWNGGWDVYVAKVNAAGNALEYATYIGGSSGDSDPNVEGAVGIAVDSGGAMYVGGSTQSSNWPTTAGAYDTTLGGTADAFVAKIIIPPAVLSPNGGEEIWAGSTYTVTWADFPPSAEKFELEYSTDDGTTWETISDTVTSTVYLWDIPAQNGNTTESLVKVTGLTLAELEVGSDTSDNPFTIQTLKLTAPSAADITLNAGDDYDIQWENHGLESPIEQVQLEYTRDGGSNWLPIETLTETQWLDSGSHSYTWTVPNPPAETNDCRVKVTLLGAGEETLVSQQSLNDFTIIPEPVSVTTVGYPNGGEEIWAGSTPEITWSAPREAEKFKLQYSTDNGATWILIAKDLTETTYPWPLPTQNGNKAQCLVKVTAYTSSNAVVGSDVSDGPFAIQTLKLVAPSDPGHILTAYDTYPIVWDTYGHKTLPTKVKLDYSKDGGITWQPIVALTDGKSVGSGVHSYMWEVPNPPVDKTKCKARVTLLGAGGVVLGRDQSLNNFTIVAVPVTINSPNGGESIWAGSSYSITWSAPSKAEKFKLQYSVDNGTTWKTISDTVTSTSHLWSIPTQNGNRTQCKVKVTAYTASGGLVGSDTSDKPFAIQVLELTAPTESGLTLIAGEYYSITWETQGLKTPPQKVKLQYSKDGGLTWLPIETVTLAGLPGADPGSSYNWLVPDLGATPKTKCKVKVTLIGAGGVALGNDKSDNNFTISREK